MARIGWLVDVNQCISCRACEAACKAEYGLNAGQGRRRRVVEKTTQEVIEPSGAGNGTAQVVRTFFISLACNHCDEPACLKACPKGAYTKDTTGAISGLPGAVLHNPALCVGCRRCEWACPYGAPQYNPATGKIHKCELCWQRIGAWARDHSTTVADAFNVHANGTAKYADRRRMPACVATCLAGHAIQLRNDFDAGGKIAGAGIASGNPYIPAGAKELAYNTTLVGEYAAPGESGGEGGAGANRGSNYVASWSLTYPAVRVRNRVYVKRNGGVE